MLWSAPPASTFTLEPVFLLAAAAAAVLYLRAARRERPPAWRPALFFTGLALAAAALNSPLETLAVHYLLLAHLVQNALIADWAPPLVLLGLTPAMRDAIAARAGTPFRAVTAMGVALPLWLVGWYGVHLPAVYEFALRHEWALQLEHAFLIAIGVVFWWPVLARPGGERPPAVALAYLFTAFVAAAFLGLALAFVPHPFYDYYVHAPRIWGISPLRDQNLAGTVMNGEQSVVFLAAIAYVFFALSNEDRRPASAAR